jgi:hypothetical protein
MDDSRAKRNLDPGQVLSDAFLESSPTGGMTAAEAAEEIEYQLLEEELDESGDAESDVAQEEMENARNEVRNDLLDQGLAPDEAEATMSEAERRLHEQQEAQQTPQQPEWRPDPQTVNAINQAGAQIGQQAAAIQQQYQQLQKFLGSGLQGVDPAERDQVLARAINHGHQLQAAWHQLGQQAQQVNHVRGTLAQAAMQTEKAKLIQAIPEWNASKAREVREFMQKQGYSDAELDRVWDHRAVVGAYRAMEASKPASKGKGKFAGKRFKVIGPEERERQRARDRGLVDQVLERDNIKPGSVEHMAMRIHHEILDREDPRLQRQATTGRKGRSFRPNRDSGHGETGSTEEIANRLVREGYV